MWGQSKILELTIRVSVARFMGRENIHLLMLHVVDLLLGNPGGRDRRPNYTIFVVACCAPNTDSRWWWVRAERALFKAGANIVCVYNMLLQLNPRVRGEHPNGHLPGTDTLPLVTQV